MLFLLLCTGPELGQYCVICRDSAEYKVKHCFVKVSLSIKASNTSYNIIKISGFPVLSKCTYDKNNHCLCIRNLNLNHIVLGCLRRHLPLTIALHNKTILARNKPRNQAPHSCNAALMPCAICNMQWHLLLLRQTGHATQNRIRYKYSQQTTYWWLTIVHSKCGPCHICHWCDYVIFCLVCHITEIAGCMNKQAGIICNSIRASFQL